MIKEVKLFELTTSVMSDESYGIYYNREDCELKQYDNMSKRKIT